MVSSQGAVGNLTQGMAGMNVSGQSNMMGEFSLILTWPLRLSNFFQAQLN